MTLPNEKYRLPDVDVLVIGAGLFGAIIGDWLVRLGRTVQWVDAEEPHAGSAPAACLMRPSWLTKMTAAQQAESMSVLDALYKVQDLEAKLPIGSTRVYWCSPHTILDPDRPVTRARIMELGPTDDYTQAYYRLADHGRPGQWGLAQDIVVAAGVWSRDLIRLDVLPPLAGLAPQAGAAFTWDVASEFTPPLYVSPWAPYKQMVSFLRAPGELWCGDGSALKPSSFTPDRLQASRDRCARYVQMPAQTATTHYGYRPYIKGLTAPCYVAEAYPHVHVATGGAKNGTAAAGWAAWQLGKILT